MEGTDAAEMACEKLGMQYVSLLRGTLTAEEELGPALEGVSHQECTKTGIIMRFPVLPRQQP